MAMKILITNDDGILSPALPPLARWAKKLGDVLVVAPKREQSGKSHAIDFCKEIEIKRVDLVEGVRAYSVDSTPADCVRYAVLGLGERFDLVISGINKGFNLGKDIVYSGTAGAVFEAARLEMKGIALSTDPHSFEDAINSLDGLYSFFAANSLLEINGLYNVNIPLSASDIEFTHLGRIYYTDNFVEEREGIFVQKGEPMRYHTRDVGSDIDAVTNGIISITPLTAERTHRTALEKLRAL